MTERTVDCVREVESILTRFGIGDPAGEALAIAAAATRCADTTDQASHALAMASERAAGRPLAYVTGRVRFMGLDLVTSPGALVPREETEMLGWTALGVLRGLPSDRELHLIDMCCGSGNLVCGIVANASRVRAWASDLTDGSVRVARANVERLALADRVLVVQSDLFAGLGELGLQHTIDVIVCNPPYISAGKLARDRAELLAHEPREAFDGGPYGVSILQRVVRDALGFLKSGGTLLFEIGVGQERQVSLLFERTAGYERVVLFNDDVGRPRVVAGTKKR